MIELLILNYYFLVGFSLFFFLLVKKWLICLRMQLATRTTVVIIIFILSKWLEKINKKESNKIDYLIKINKNLYYLNSSYFKWFHLKKKRKKLINIQTGCMLIIREHRKNPSKQKRQHHAYKSLFGKHAQLIFQLLLLGRIRAQAKTKRIQISNHAFLPLFCKNKFG
jgi:hypothetical protein